MAGDCKKQCSLRAFALGGEEPNKFASPQAKWPLLPVSFIIYRLIYALYRAIILILLLINWGSPPFYRQRDSKAKWLIFISNWTFLLHTSYTLWSAGTASYWHLRGKTQAESRLEVRRSDPEKYGNPSVDERNDLELTSKSIATEEESESMAPTLNTPWYFKIQWAMQNTVCAAEVFITCLYWFLEYDPGEGHFYNVNVHGVGLVLVTVDFLLVANPFRFLHFIYPSLYAIVYFAFTLIYFLAGGLNPDDQTFIYEGVLDWGSSPGMTLIVALITSLVVSPFLCGVYFLLYLLKLSFGKCCACCKYDIN
ncbi:Protein rolling stone [Holothuria leucospilota]|uniref:Protein rolling stone n=1 Tax=Holothuria leucospilota TaxID=206669 RepID=A0A9Q1BFA0_HOLLE|nr:Protein rolling stone [Holothuria leucospilota]